MRHEIIGNIYKIYSETGEELFSVEITDKPNNQVIIKTENEVFSGPLHLLYFATVIDEFDFK